MVFGTSCRLGPPMVVGEAFDQREASLADGLLESYLLEMRTPRDRARVHQGSPLQEHSLTYTNQVPEERRPSRILGWIVRT
jgi:hypothetical protein